MPSAHDKQIVIDGVREERIDLARVLKKHTGIRRIVEDLYPDSAHFIYELLQNAEDTGATEVYFDLKDGSLTFEHNGRPFSEADIFGITDVGEGTKANDLDTIGNFGVGFKAVFAYTESPRIWSSTFSFEINELVLPSLLSDESGLDGKTRFEFPFNNPKKPKGEAFAEVARGLRDLAETTLLFLTNINAINWNIENGERGAILRLEHAGEHIEVLKENNGAKTVSSHFLRFSAPVEGLEKRTLAVAFALEPLPDCGGYFEDKPLAAQFRIVRVLGQVAVFFPAKKEISGLRFHVHAPFVPELSRASIKDTPANDPLFVQLATLSVTAIRGIRDFGLLSTDFLDVLPNPIDVLDKRYDQIRNAIIEAFNEEPLTPTYAKGHAPAKFLLQAKPALKELLKPDDLNYVFEYHDDPLQWAGNRARQGTCAERFLNGLAIKEWDVSNFLFFVSERGDVRWGGPDKDFIVWLSQKPVEWLQQFYALFAGDSESADELFQLREARIIRLANGTLSTGVNSYFIDDDRTYLQIVNCVDPAVYETGKNKTHQKFARKFLEEVGVKEVGERELVKALLEREYVSDDHPLKQRDHATHLRRIIKLIESDASSINVIKKYKIFLGSDGKWHKPFEVFLDIPFLDTGLTEYYELIGKKDGQTALAPCYEKLPIDTPKVLGLAQALGAITAIKVSKARCQNNPKWTHLRSAPGQRWTSTGLNEDFAIAHFDRLVGAKSVRIARLIWKSLNEYGSNPAWIKACFQRNYSNGCREADSQVVCQLRSAAWIPQSGGEFVKPSDARADLLPEGFVYDPGLAWLKKIEFGKAIELQTLQAQADAAAALAKKNRKMTAAEELGFDRPDDLALLEKLSEISAEERDQLFAELEQRRKIVDLPEHEPRNPERRSEKVGSIAAGAPERLTEKRSRSVSVGHEDVKNDADQYLLQQYTNGDELFCQICKSPMPFKLADGTPYFETVEFADELRKRYHQNYLALCPNHAAMFKYANGSDGVLLNLLLSIDGNELDVTLAQTDYTIYFTKTHIADLNTIIKLDRNDVDDSADDDYA